MKSRLSLSIAVFVLVAGYMLSPAVALWGLMSALKSGDVAALERGVDWASVRNGLKQDISEGIIAAFGGPSTSSTQLATNVLPPFGASFVTGIAGSAIDHDVTAENVVAITHQVQAEPSADSMLPRIEHAHFDSPTDFTIALRTSDDEDSHLRLHMVLRDGHWVVVRAWVPQDMIDFVSQRT